MSSTPNSINHYVFIAVADNFDYRGAPKLVSAERMQHAVDILLGMQNTDGGFASYELIRGPWWLEWLNPAEVFGDIMIEHSYPECTTSVITALSIFRRHYPKYRASDIQCVVFLISAFKDSRTMSLGV